MLQLEPRKEFSIIRQLNDPLDTDTLYVRAFIRDSNSDDLLDTVDLADKGGHRFTYNYRIPADKTGEGTFIDITTRVFTDSGYSSESDVYGKEVDTFLVKETWNRIHNPGGGDPLAGPHKPDYSGFGKILDKRIKDIKFPEQQKIDLQPVIDAINNIHIPDPIIPEKFPIGAITRLIEQVRMKVEALPKPIKPKEVDFTGVSKEISNSLEKIREMIETVNTLRASDSDQLNKKFKALINKVQDKTFITMREKERKKKQDEKPWRKHY